MAAINYFFILLCMFALSFRRATSLASHDHRHLQMVMQHEEWIAKHGRNYASLEEKEKRFRIFKDNVEFIKRFNKGANRTYKVGVNKFADLTNEEFLAKYTAQMPSIQTSLLVSNSSFEYDENEVGELPEGLDWRALGAVTPVKNQGPCGCCWAFSAVSSIESIAQIKTGTLQSLSEQQIIDCYGGHDPCSGGRLEDVYYLVNRTGRLASDADYPYQVDQQHCIYNVPSSLGVPITGYVRLPDNNERAMLAAVNNQPLSVGIDPVLFQFYQSGVITGECGTYIRHAVTLVGYGTDEYGTKFWLFKNSWGLNWGENGYLRVQRDVDYPEGMCGVAMYVIYPTA